MGTPRSTVDNLRQESFTRKPKLPTARNQLSSSSNNNSNSSSSNPKLSRKDNSNLRSNISNRAELVKFMRKLR